MKAPRLFLAATSMFLAMAIHSNATAADGPAGWARGFEGQRVADLGNGTYLNPVLAGDHPDPSVVKVGADYYMVHSSFQNVPGLMIWHSLDLVNWKPIGPALNKNVGIVWAPDISYHDGKFYIYLPVLATDHFTNMVVTATDIRGPWSDPVDLGVPNFDPGHGVGADGKRYLFFNGGTMAPLSADGLSIAGPMKKVYDGWPIPEHWEIETFAQEGPKILRHGDYFYMVLAEGGTAGPATSHMVIMARAKNIEGPWENSPYNPIVRTGSSLEKWWSRGHATLVEGPDGKQWYLVYHAYEKDYLNLGRQTLLEPVEWTEDGWVKACGYDVSKPIPMPVGGEAVTHGFAFSDDFSTNKIGTQWTFFEQGAPTGDRARYEGGALVLKAAGTSPKDSSPLSFVCGDQAYEVEVEVDCDEGATGGLMLFYSDRLFAGLAFSANQKVEYWKGDVSSFPKPDIIGKHFFLRLRNNHNYVTVWYSPDGTHWERHWMNFEVTGYNHNTAGGFLSLRPSLVAVGQGEVRYRNFKYKALP